MEHQTVTRTLTATIEIGDVDAETAEEFFRRLAETENGGELRVDLDGLAYYATIKTENA